LSLHVALRGEDHGLADRVPPPFHHFVQAAEQVGGDLLRSQKVDQVLQ